MPETSSGYKADSILTALNGSMLTNAQTGMGSTSSDPFTQTRVGYPYLLGEQELRALYRGSWFIRRIIDTPAQDMTKGGVNVTIHEGGDEQDAADAIAIYDAGTQNASPYSK